MHKGLLFVGACFIIGAYDTFYNNNMFIGVYGISINNANLSILISIISLIFGIFSIVMAFKK